jgi:hypothetical protein
MALVAACVALIAVVVWLLVALTGHPLVGLVLGIAVGGAVVAVAARRAPAAVLASVGAEPADDKANARYHNVVEG